MLQLGNWRVVVGRFATEWASAFAGVVHHPSTLKRSSPPQIIGQKRTQIRGGLSRRSHRLSEIRLSKIVNLFKFHGQATSGQHSPPCKKYQKILELDYTEGANLLSMCASPHSAIKSHAIVRPTVLVAMVLSQQVTAPGHLPAQSAVLPGK